MSRSKKTTIWAALGLILVVFHLGPAPAFGECGEMYIVSLDSARIPDVYALGETGESQPEILDAWTTDDPFGDPFTVVTEFTIGTDTLALVTAYYHAGGFIPVQFARAFRCAEEEWIVKTCRYQWTVGPLTEGHYLLINYYDPVPFRAGVYDWAVKVGDNVFGYPDISISEPECFTLQE